MNKCCETVYPREQWGYLHGHPCGKPAKLEHHGKWYCKIHHPPSATARHEAKPKCAYDGCITSAKGSKYCSFHASVTVQYERLLALQMDRDRLDWWINNSATTLCKMDGKFACYLGSRTVSQWYDTPRQAIDEVMEKSSGLGASQ